MEPLQAHNLHEYHSVTDHTQHSPQATITISAELTNVCSLNPNDSGIPVKGHLAN